jgi:hypothetical protein
MSVSDQEVVESFRQFRRFCRQVQLMLGTADAMMAVDGWMNPGGNASAAYGDTSQSLAKPDLWLPQYFCRFYVHAQRPGILAFLSVILDETPDPKLVTAAIASAGWFDYGKRKPGSD